LNPTARHTTCRPHCHHNTKQVLGCSAALDPAGKQYCYKKRTCAACMQANAVLLSDRSCTAYRFCQQCGKFESIEKFDGSKRCVCLLFV
jgi:hypothetical protein